jgi:4'-phosphopantetheinyl transferase
MSSEWRALIQGEAPPVALRLGADEVHVWCASPQASSSQLPALRQTLSPAECNRSQRFRFARDRDTFITARGWLRVLLGRYLQRDPADLQFAYSPTGKPSLVEEPAALQFNVAHTDGLILLAVARERELGIDVEIIQPEFPFASIVEQYFAPPEIVTLQNLAPAAQPLAFFKGWTRKEAYLKARGDGLSAPLNQFVVPLTNDAPFSLEDNWTLYPLTPAPEYVGALAVAGHSHHLRFFRVS